MNFKYLAASLVIFQMVVGTTVMCFFGFWYGLGSCLLITTVFHFFKKWGNRSEAAWEITEKGTKQLWNDGPKTPDNR